MLRVLARWIPAVLWMALIYYLSSKSGDELNSYLPFFHRFFPQMESFDWGHFIAYFVLAVTVYWGMGRLGWTWKGKFLVIILCSLYGVTDEYHQSFTSQRTPDTADLRNDTIGAAIAMIFVSIGPIPRWFKKPGM